MAFTIISCDFFIGTKFKQANREAFDTKYGENFNAEKYNGIVYEITSGIYENQYSVSVLTANKEFKTFIICNCKSVFEKGDTIRKNEGENFIFINNKRVNIVDCLCKPD